MASLRLCTFGDRRSLWSDARRLGCWRRPRRLRRDSASSRRARKLRTYFKNNPPKSLHHRAMLAWCSIRIEGIATSGFGDGKVFLSEDNGQSWAHRAAFPDAADITFSRLLKNGNILFATREKVFLRPDNLKTHREIVVKNHDGNDYRPHAAKNPNQPGWCRASFLRLHRRHQPRTWNQCHWLRGVYDAQADRRDWTVLISVNSNSRYKSGGINFVAGQLYWAADANGPKPPAEKHDRGVFRCAPADLTDPAKHTRLFNAKFEMANMIIQDGVILAGHCAPSIRHSKRASPSRPTWAGHGSNTIWPSSAHDLPSASRRKTVTAGSGSICERDGSMRRGPFHQTVAMTWTSNALFPCNLPGRDLEGQFEPFRNGTKGRRTAPWLFQRRQILREDVVFPASPVRRSSA